MKRSIAIALVVSLSAIAFAGGHNSLHNPHPSPPIVHDEAPATPDDIVLDRAAIRAQLAAARAANLAAFRAYVKAGTFPSNTYKPGELNVWRDRDGHLCAAATIIAKSGATDLVAQTARQNNFIRLADVNDGPLMTWILHSGFTQEELVAIQKPFSPVTVRPSVTQPVAVDPSLRAAETARLLAKYAEVDKQLVANEQHSLDVATDRWIASYGAME
ncbi:MAG TPA: hypothetical protein VLX92_10460 [Kofleriaceae bacterium]|nr:hypothetical protein [Kofleriaceae bacterium]